MPIRCDDPEHFAEVRYLPDPPKPKPLPKPEDQFARWLASETARTLDEYVGWTLPDETAA